MALVEIKSWEIFIGDLSLNTQQVEEISKVIGDCGFNSFDVLLGEVHVDRIFSNNKDAAASLDKKLTKMIEGFK